VCWGLDYTPTLLPRQLSLQAVDIVADALALPIAAESMDVVLMIELIEHIRAPNRLLQQARSVLRPGGILILTAPFLYPVHGAPDYVRFTELGLGSLCERNGFEIIRSESFGSFWGFLAQSSNIYLSRWPERSPLLALLAAVLRPVLLLAIAVVNVGLRPLDALDQRRDFALGHLIVAQKPIGQEKYGI
jgi:SAM-dependent methyltransferase